MPLTAERVATSLIRSATCRAQRGKRCAQWAKVRVISHSCAHISREVSVALANSATADRVVMRFMPQSAGVMPNSRAEKSYLGSWTFFEVKKASMTNPDHIWSRGHPPPGPERARGVRNAHTKEDDLSRVQPVRDLT